MYSLTCVATRRRTSRMYLLTDYRRLCLLSYIYIQPLPTTTNQYQRKVLGVLISMIVGAMFVLGPSLVS